jgi:hypothetical protein|nr:MAG: hypothetical protein DIU56_09755 [Pseudomonadota bacterium]
MTSPFVLVVGVLNTQSSYLRDTEEERADVPDTVQFWFTPDSDWRVRTYAMDHDIHVYEIRERGVKRAVGAHEAVESIQRHYEEVLDELHVIELDDPLDAGEVQKKLSSHGLSGTLQIGRSGVAFYNPDGGRYHTQSTPD